VNGWVKWTSAVLLLVLASCTTPLTAAHPAFPFFACTIDHQKRYERVVVLRDDPNNPEEKFIVRFPDSNLSSTDLPIPKTDVHWVGCKSTGDNDQWNGLKGGWNGGGNGPS
jgi:hypothetical protein